MGKRARSQLSHHYVLQVSSLSCLLTISRTDKNMNVECVTGFYLFCAVTTIRNMFPDPNGEGNISFFKLQRLPKQSSLPVAKNRKTITHSEMFVLFSMTTWSVKS